MTRKQEDWAIALVTIVVVGLIHYGLVLAGEPQMTWLYCEMLGWCQ